MPTYQYACTDCGHQFDAFQSFSDAALTECPECTGTLRKVYGSVGVVFKGSGFYRTDSRSGNGKSAAGGPAKDRSDSSKSADKAPAAASAGSGSSGSPSSAKSSAPAAAAS